jgi:hypothetical protein
MSNLRDELIKIAGVNVLADNDLEKAKMVKTMNYFVTQTRLAIGDIEDGDIRKMTMLSFENVCDWTAEMLSK